MADPLYETEMIKGTDIEMDVKADDPVPGPVFPSWSGDNPWKPKTDWSRDGIIASDD